MAFKIFYEGKEYSTNLKEFKGQINIEESPFRLNYNIVLESNSRILSIGKYSEKMGCETIYNKFLRIKRGSFSGTMFSENNLKSIDDCFNEELGLFKIEVRKGVVYFQNKPLVEYNPELYKDILHRINEGFK